MTAAILKVAKLVPIGNSLFTGSRSRKVFRKKEGKAGRPNKDKCTALQMDLGRNGFTTDSTKKSDRRSDRKEWPHHSSLGRVDSTWPCSVLCETVTERNSFFQAER